MRMAREVGPVGPTETGAYALTTFSQTQLDELVRAPGTIGWIIDNVEKEATVIQVEPNYLPLATFSLRNPLHRSALNDVLNRGTLHLCAAESADPDAGVIGGLKMAIDIRDADRATIRMVLESPID